MVDDRHPGRLKTLIAFRVVFVTLLLGSFFYFNIGRGVFPYPFSVLYLIIFMYSASIVYLIFLGRIPHIPHGYAQMIVDTLAVIALIYMTGGIESWFSWLLLVVVFLSAIVVSGRAAFTMATIGSLLYGLIINWQFYGVVPLPYQSMLEEKDFLYKALSHIGGLYTIAFLSGHLVHRLHQSNEDLEDLSKFNRDVIESSPSGIVTTDLTGKVLLFNRSAESIMGMGRSEARGLRLVDIFPFIMRATDENRAEGVINVGGEERTIGLSVSALIDSSGRQTGYICIFQDLSELKRLSREIKRKESLAAIGELSANIAHEIRNPLASLKSSMEMLKEGSMGDDQKKRLMDIALSEMDRLNNTITDFLKFSKPSPLSVASFDLAVVLDEMLDLLMNRDNLAPVEFMRQFVSPMPIVADQDKLKDVFWNLGINALDAMSAGGTLRVSAYEEGDNVVIIFSDTGPGLDAAAKEKVFFPFYTSKSTGTGLGLSTAYRVIDDHGGGICIEDTLGGGASFIITLPKREDE